MKRLLLLALVGLVGLAGLAWTVSMAPFGRAEAATFHIDFEHGRDEGDGLTAATAWKHAPGDPVAQGIPARTNLRAGDVVSFASNVRYRGTIRVTASGAPGAPIVFAGEGLNASAVIDGSEPAAGVAPCKSAEDCGGAAGWQQLVRVEADAPITETSALFTDTGPLRPAQTPNPQDGFYRDEIDDMLVVDGNELTTGRVTLPHAIAVGLAAGGGRVALWAQPNLIVYRPILSMEGDVAIFDPTGLHFYIGRPDRAAAIDHVSLIDQPGEYAVLPGGKAAVVMLPAGAGSVSIGSGRGGFIIKGGSNLVFRNLGFEKMSDGGKYAPNGVAIFADKVGTSNIVIENNRFRWFDMPRGQGPISLRGINDVRISGNKIDTISLGSGMRLTGPASHFVVENNEIRRLGRTGIMLMGLSDVTVQRNVISDILGVHGNGMSAYLDNHDIRVVANTVTNAKQPVTFHGNGQNATRDTNILFANNLFISTPKAAGSLISWGDWTRGVTIRNNVLLGGKTGLRMNAKDSGVVISDNVAAGLIIIGDQPADWRLAGNEWTALTYQQKRNDTRLSSKFTSAEAMLASGRVPPGICAVIARDSLGEAPPADATSRAVGAELTCP